ncbi:MAG: tRNA pseudouridine38-40 synthase [Paraglaciecola sp.]|jgi:tRNA pseudouridine38-40 synthase
MNYFLHIAYDGSTYRGWQFQPNVPSVQEAIEKALTQIFNVPVFVHGCGRTDAQVHASQYFLNFKIEKTFDFDLKFRLNKTLPKQIVVFDILEMADHQHSRFDAISRTYDYFIHFKKSPFLVKYSSYYELENFDIAAMQQAVQLLTQYTNFKSFCKSPDAHNHTICQVTNAQLFFNTNQNRLRFTITGNRFLRGMVRLCMAFLLDVGKGKLSLATFEKMLSKQFEMPKKPAKPHGLYLSKVEYPYLKMTAVSEMCEFLKMGLKN